MRRDRVKFRNLSILLLRCYANQNCHDRSRRSNLHADSPKIFSPSLNWQTLSSPFTDISKTNLEMLAALCKRDIKENKLPAKVRTSANRIAMLEGADYVFCTIRQGGLEAFQTDIDVPLKYGVDQCVGDTLCAGGIMYAQRTIPALLEFCREIRAVAKPDVLFMNYANPMAMNTWACNHYGAVRTVGLCHGVQGAHWQITHCIET